MSEFYLNGSVSLITPRSDIDEILAEFKKEGYGLEINDKTARIFW